MADGHYLHINGFDLFNLCRVHSKLVVPSLFRSSNYLELEMYLIFLIIACLESMIYASS
jgi:hypothetical protein